MKIAEIFYSLQGEGLEIGLPTIFIRTSGCNLRCRWCDTEYAWEDGDEYTVERIKDKIGAYPVKRVCITGGEPLMQEELLELIDELVQNYEISIETNGSIDIGPISKKDVQISMDYKPPSSGMCEKMRDKNIDILKPTDLLKFVIAHREDYRFAKERIKKLKPCSEIVFQPVHGTDLRELAGWVIDDGIDVRVLPQLHKIIWDQQKGV